MNCVVDGCSDKIAQIWFLVVRTLQHLSALIPDGLSIKTELGQVAVVDTQASLTQIPAKGFSHLEADIDQIGQLLQKVDP